MNKLTIRKTAPILVGLSFWTAIISTPVQAQSQIQSLPNGNYKFCSNPPMANQVTEAYAGYCFVFRKTGNRLAGDYYDPKTFGEVSVCVSGAIANNTLTGEGIESIGDVGHQSLLPSSEGSRLVKWDDRGFLQVAGATVIRKYDERSKVVRYRRALLNLNRFHRYQLAKAPPKDCLNRYNV